MAIRTITDFKNGTANTVNNSTQVPLVTFDTSVSAPGGTALNNCTIFITAQAAGFDTTNTKSAGEMVAGVFKVVAGTLTQVGATSTIVNVIDDTTGTPSIGFSVSGTVITFWVVGVAAAMTWFGTADYLIYQPV